MVLSDHECRKAIQKDDLIQGFLHAGRSELDNG